MKMIIPLLLVVLTSQQDCDLCELEKQKEWTRTGFNQSKFAHLSNSTKESINQTLIQNLDIDIEDLKQNPDIVKQVPMDLLVKAIRKWNEISYKDKTERIKKIKVKIQSQIPTYYPVPVYTVYQAPMLHHFPVEQIEREISPQIFKFPVEKREQIGSFQNTQTIYEPNIIPTTVTFDQKVPIPVRYPNFLNQTQEVMSPPSLINNLADMFDLMDQQKVEVKKEKNQNIVKNLRGQYADMVNEIDKAQELKQQT